MGSQRLITGDSVFDCAVMIVGGGPAGISTWLHLQKYAPQLASRALLIEKAVFPRDKLCAGAVGVWSEDVLEHLEVELDIPSVFVSDVEIKFGEEICHFHEPNCFRVVQRMDFDYALVKTAVNRGLELHEDEMLIDVTRSQDRLIVTTNRRKYGVQTLIGADGALSVVRRKMMPSHKPRLAPTIQIYAAVNPQYDTEFNEKKVVLDLGPIHEGLQGYVWHVPCLKDGAPSIVHGIVDFRVYPDKPRADMKKIFSRELQSRNIQKGIKSWSSYPIHWFSNEDILSEQNIILVGDAVGNEPAFGGGIHMALSYGEIAARAIIDAFQDDIFSFHDYRQRLQSHFVGRSIHEYTRLALEIYGGEMNPLDRALKFFTKKYERPDLLSLLLSGASSHPAHIKDG